MMRHDGADHLIIKRAECSDGRQRDGQQQQ
jgi:hypothetical protein